VFDKSVNQEMKTVLTEDNVDYKLASADDGKKSKKKPRMVPLFSRRSLIILTIGFIIGALLGLGLWAVASSRGKIWEGKVDIQAINSGSSFVPITTLQSRAAYYANKVRSYPFLEFLSQDLRKQNPKYAHSIEELNRIISIEYNQYSTTPVFSIVVRTPTSDETAFLVSHIPEVFVSFVTIEDSKKQKDTYQNTLDSIANVKKALLDAEQERRNYQTQIAASDIQNNATYIALNARIRTLEPELQTKSNELTALVVAGNTGNYSAARAQEYQVTLNQAKDVNTALFKAEQELQALEEQKNDTNKDATIITLNAKIRALEAELDKFMAGYTTTSDGTISRVMGLAEMIAAGDTNSIDYQNALKKIDATSNALAEANKELTLLHQSTNSTTPQNDLDYQVAQTKVGSFKTQLSALNNKLGQLVPNASGEADQQEIQTTFARTSAALSDAKKELAILMSQASSNISEASIGAAIAQAKVDNFNTTLSNLNTSLASLTGNTNTPPVTDSLAVVKPRAPESVVPIQLSTAGMGGIIIGVCGGWLFLNFRWLLKMLSAPPEEDKDEV
jgi:hypothetical protein